MRIVSANRVLDDSLADQINAFHAQAEQQRERCCDAVYEGLLAAWEAGNLLIQQKKSVSHGNWELWLKRHFNGTVRTAQRYMRLAKSVRDIGEMRGFTLRQAYLRLGITVASAPSRQDHRRNVLPLHATLANRFARFIRQNPQVDTLGKPEKQTLRRDLRPVHDWLNRLFEDDSIGGHGR